MPNIDFHFDCNHIQRAGKYANYTPRGSTNIRGEGFQDSTLDSEVVDYYGICRKFSKQDVCQKHPDCFWCANPGACRHYKTPCPIQKDSSISTIFPAYNTKVLRQENEEVSTPSSAIRKKFPSAPEDVFTYEGKPIVPITVPDVQTVSGTGLMTKLIMEKCIGREYPIESKQIYLGTKVMRGKFAKLVFNDPLPIVPDMITDRKTKEQVVKEYIRITKKDAMYILCQVDTMMAKLCEEFDGLPGCNRFYEGGRNLLSIHITGNESYTEINLDLSTNAMANQIQMFVPMSLISKALHTNDFTSVLLHETWHAIDPTMYDKDWGSGIREMMSCYLQYRYFKNGSRNFSTVYHLFSKVGEGYKNPFSWNRLRFNVKILGSYTPLFWAFYSMRYGGWPAIKDIIKNDRITDIVNKKINFMEGIANHIGISKNMLALQWMSDLMTVRFFRIDPERLDAAKAYFANVWKDMDYALCLDENLIWNESYHTDFDTTEKRTGKYFYGIMNKYQLEAFGLATYDLHHICTSTDIPVGSSVTIRVNSIPEENDDVASWVLVVVTGKGHDNVQGSTSNTIRVTVPSTKPFMLGVMHTNTKRFVGNVSAGSAKSYKLSVTRD